MNPKNTKTITLNYAECTSTSKFIELVSSRLKEIKNIEAGSNEERKFDMYNITWKNTDIDGIIITSDIVKEIENIPKTVNLVFDNCNIKNLDFTNVFLIQLPIKFSYCRIDKVSTLNSVFSMIQFTNCNICSLQLFDSRFLGVNAFSLESSIVNYLGIKCSRFENMKISKCNIDKFDMMHNQSNGEIRWDITTFNKSYFFNNDIDWTLDKNELRNCSFVKIDKGECNTNIIAINGAGIDTIYYFPDLEVIKYNSSTYTFDQFDFYIDGLEMSYKNASKTESAETIKFFKENKLELEAIKLAYAYIKSIKNKYDKETKSIKTK